MNQEFRYLYDRVIVKAGRSLDYFKRNKDKVIPDESLLCKCIMDNLLNLKEIQNLVNVLYYYEKESDYPQRIVQVDYFYGIFTKEIVDFLLKRNIICTGFRRITDPEVLDLFIAYLEKKSITFTYIPEAILENKTVIESLKNAWFSREGNSLFSPDEKKIIEIVYKNYGYGIFDYYYRLQDLYVIKDPELINSLIEKDIKPLGLEQILFKKSVLEKYPKLINHVKFLTKDREFVRNVISQLPIGFKLNKRTLKYLTKAKLLDETREKLTMFGMAKLANNLPARYGQIFFDVEPQTEIDNNDSSEEDRQIFFNVEFLAENEESYSDKSEGDDDTSNDDGNNVNPREDYYRQLDTSMKGLSVFMIEDLDTYLYHNDSRLLDKWQCKLISYFSKYQHGEYFRLCSKYHVLFKVLLDRLKLNKPKQVFQHLNNVPMTELITSKEHGKWYLRRLSEFQRGSVLVSDSIILKLAEYFTLEEIVKKTNNVIEMERMLPLNKSKTKSARK